MKVNQITQESRFDRRDAYQRDYDSSVSGMGRGDDHRGLRQELAHERNNIQIAINGRPWKVVAGRGTADSAEERSYLEGMKRWAERKSASSGKTWTVYLTGAEVSEGQGVAEGKPREKEADYGADYQDMVARVKKLAGMGPLKTVYDPQKRVYRNVPTAVQPPKK
jgi:hypothetical protein